jgi:ribonuclease E
MLEDEVQPTATPEAEAPKAPRRRRTKAQIEADKAAEAAKAAEAPSAVETAETTAEDKPKRTRKKAAPKTEAAADSSAEDAAPVAAEEAPKPKRTRKKVEPKAENAETAKSEAPKEEAAASAPADTATSEEKPAPVRRTRKRTTKSAENAADAGTEVPAAAQIPAAQTPAIETPAAEARKAPAPKKSKWVNAAPEATPAPESAKAAEPQKAQEAKADTPTDPLEAELAQLKSKVADRKAEKTVDPHAAEALDALVAAISGDESEDGEVHRRRRRRGGRRRRRSEDGEELMENGDSEAVAETQEQPEAQEQAETNEQTETGAEGEEDGTGRRRRRRRRRGEALGEADDDPENVVVRVRDPKRNNKPVKDEVSGIEGSTRVEAKRQRRREGRTASRRRAPILSESEFLARRESVDRMMLIRQTEDYAQLAVMEDGVLVEHYVDRPSSAGMIGNIYLGKVQNVLPSMEAAFIDIGRHRNAVLYAGEVDWEAFDLTGQNKKIEQAFKPGQTVVVQVTKDPVGTKGARLTAHMSLPGRYIVYSPGGHLSGVSRKLPENERHRLKSILDSLIPSKASVIIRTAAEGASEEELIRDVNRVKAQWEVIEKKAAAGGAPQLLYSEPDLTIRIVRDLFSEDFSKLVIDGNGEIDDAYETISAYIQHVAPQLADRLVRWDREKNGDLFDFHRVQEQVMKALERKVYLPSGGSLVIDRTEAMTVIDVNTGRFTGSAGNLEATVTANNLEAAEEIVRQLRLRDIGGIIVIDFIDMVLPANRELLLRRLVEALGRDRTRHQVAEVSSLGLVQMTRKKIGTGLAEAFTVPCETCNGRGYHIHDAPVATQAPADGGDRKHKGGKKSGRKGGRK